MRSLLLPGVVRRCWSWQRGRVGKSRTLPEQAQQVRKEGSRKRDLSGDLIGLANLRGLGFLLCCFFLADLAPFPAALKWPVTVSGTCAGTAWACEGMPGGGIRAEKSPGDGEEIEGTPVSAADAGLRNWDLFPTGAVSTGRIACVARGAEVEFPHRVEALVWGRCPQWSCHPPTFPCPIPLLGSRCSL